MSDEYTQELRTDSILYLTPTTFIIVLLLSVGVFVAHSEFLGQGVNAPFFLGNSLGSFLICYISWRLAHDGRQQASGAILVSLHLILLTVNLYYLWNPQSFIPYLYIYFIAISAAVLDSRASFYTWAASVVLMTAVPALRGEFTWTTVMPMGMAWFLGLTIAVSSYLGTLEWALALEWANNLRSTISQRRDELFATQEELKRANARQEFLYKQLNASVVVGQQITSILDLDKMLQEVTNLISQQFGFDYVGIFLLSEDGQTLRVWAESDQKTGGASGAAAQAARAATIDQICCWTRPIYPARPPAKGRWFC
jgi:hypothetical protein